MGTGRRASMRVTCRFVRLASRLGERQPCTETDQRDLGRRLEPPSYRAAAEEPPGGAHHRSRQKGNREYAPFRIGDIRELRNARVGRGE
jgi:hypothetical protein